MPINWPVEAVLTAGYVLVLVGQWRIASGQRSGFLLNILGTFAGVSVGLYLGVWSMAFWSVLRVIPNVRGWLLMRSPAEKDAGSCST